MNHPNISNMHMLALASPRQKMKTKPALYLQIIVLDSAGSDAGKLEINKSVGLVGSLGFQRMRVGSRGAGWRLAGSK